MTKDSPSILLKVSTRLFAKNGYEATSIRDIARDSKMNVAMVSYYFGSKEGLYQAVLEAHIKTIVAIIQKADSPALSPEEKIKQYALGVIALFQKHPHFARLMGLESSSPTAIGDKIIGTYLDKGFIFVTSNLQEGVNNGLFRVDIDIHHSAFLLAGILNFYLLSHKQIKNAYKKLEHKCDEKGYINNALEIFFNGIKNH